MSKAEGVRSSWRWEELSDVVEVLGERREKEEVAVLDLLRRVETPRLIGLGDWEFE